MTWWTWDGRTRGVFLTVAGARGAAVSSTLTLELVNAIHQAGDPFVPVRVASYKSARFRVAARIAIHPDYEPARVLDGVSAAWQEAFSFERRDFGQPVILSEVIALGHAVPGVVAMNLTKLHRTGAAAKLNSRLEAALPAGGNAASPTPAELLTLDPAFVHLEVMT